MLAAHDTRNRFGTVFIGDHTHAGVQLVLALVKRQNGFAIPGRTHRQIALDLGRVEDMQRTCP